METKRNNAERPFTFYDIHHVTSLETTTSSDCNILLSLKQVIACSPTMRVRAQTRVVALPRRRLDSSAKSVLSLRVLDSNIVTDVHELRCTVLKLLTDRNVQNEARDARVAAWDILSKPGFSCSHHFEISHRERNTACGRKYSDAGVIWFQGLILF